MFKRRERVLNSSQLLAHLMRLRLLFASLTRKFYRPLKSEFAQLSSAQLSSARYVVVVVSSILCVVSPLLSS